ncbi:ABC transporter substrate-binding protein [Parapusillimonas granuli]|nr:ABC transporter substrate-binding protein [Parapusillimonas granuli]MBB5216172.1 ABC-type branched-subunit amino acid transport system substrate-binding protein [Parapusillimonas granuli]MEB2400447.1 ABC transporter substrate-binding protein [Alcaligenaceae bacterium]
MKTTWQYTMDGKRHASRRGVAAALAGLVLAVAAPAAAWAQSYTLGTLFPMSGPNAEAGAIYSNAVDLALKHLEDDKWLKGKISVKPTDSLGTPQGGAVGMSRLVNVEKVPYALVGFTGVSKAAAPIGDRAKVLMVNGGAVGPDLASLSRYFWNIIPLANQEVEFLIPWLGEQKIKRIATIYVDDPLGQGILSELKKGLPGVGGELVSSYSVTPDLQQFSPIIARLRNDNPEVIYIASPNITQISHIIKQVRDGGLNTQLITYGVANFPSISKLPESDGLIFTSQAADWASSEPTMKRFVDDWRKAYGTEPTTYGLNYYNGALLYGYLLRGLEQAGKPATGANLLEELERVGKYSLAGGEARFRDSTVTTAMQINRIKNGVTEKIK